MAKNDFKAFATDRNANVISQEEWEALPALLSGFTAGKASSAQVNKVIRQASFIAAALAQFVSDKTQRDVLDNGDLPGFVELLGSGFAVEYLSRKNPFGDIKSDGTVRKALENLSLGAFISSPSTIPGDFSQVSSPDGKSYLFIANSKNWGAQELDGTAIPLILERGGTGATTPEGARAAFGLGDSATKNVGTTAGTVAAGDDSRLVNLKSAANRNVGNGANQIPDMSYFTTGVTSSGQWAKLPSGLIIQDGTGITSPLGTATVNLPIPFTGTFCVVGGSIEGNGPIFVSARGLTQSTIGVVAWGRDGSIQVTNIHWLAIGV
ncbi:carbohydrate kinase [Escherichia coli]